MAKQIGRGVDLPAGPQSHPEWVREAYERVLSGSTVRARSVTVGASGRVNLVEKGSGPALVMLHGSGGSAGFFVPLLDRLDGVHALAPDRPGQGLSDPIDLPRRGYREAVVTWLDDLLDALGLEVTALLGHSGGGVWALWYALARPERVRRLVLMAPPALPGTRCPLPIRLATTPGLGELMSSLVRPTRESMLRFATFMGEGESILGYPELVDLFVAAFRDPVAERTTRDEERVLVSPFALVQPSGFRRRTRVGADELRRLVVPTLLAWGQRDPLGGASVASALAELMPEARADVFDGGHAPWLGQPGQVAASIVGFLT